MATAKKPPAEKAPAPAKMPAPKMYRCVSGISGWFDGHQFQFEEGREYESGPVVDWAVDKYPELFEKA